MYEWGSEKLIISEINENDSIPYISAILGDTCPPNYNHQVTIYGQNFRPDSTVNIPGTTNLITTVVSPTEITVEFTSGAIVGAFNVEVKNSDHSSILWGQNNKLNIITPTGGTLPLLDTWIDCRINGSPDAMIGEILKDNNSTWTRGVFGYNLTSLSSLASNWLFYLRLNSFSFSFDIPLALEFIIFTSTYSQNIRWGLYPVGDISLNLVQGFTYIPNPSYHYYTLGHNNTPINYFLSEYIPVSSFFSNYIKIIMKPRYIAFCQVDPNSFQTLTKNKEIFISSTIWENAIFALKNSGYSRWVFGARLYPGGINLSNFSHLTAFKLSWA